MFVNFAVALGFLGRITEQGTVNVFGLGALRHCTNVISWISIHIFGTIPAMDGNRIGGDYHWKRYSQNSVAFEFARTLSMVQLLVD